MFIATCSQNPYIYSFNVFNPDPPLLLFIACLLVTGARYTVNAHAIVIVTIDYVFSQQPVRLNNVTKHKICD